jgi:hypothetical protein
VIFKLHQLRVLLPMYAPPPGLENFTHLFDIAGGPAVHLAYMGFLRFRTFDDARGSLRVRREQVAAVRTHEHTNTRTHELTNTTHEHI